MNIIGDYAAHKRDEEFDKAEDRRKERKAELERQRQAKCTCSDFDGFIDCPVHI